MPGVREPVGDRADLRRDVTAIGASTAAYVLACQIGFFFPSSGRLVMEVWPAAGIGLAALLLNPLRRWPWLVGAFFVSGAGANMALAHKPFAEAIGYMTANMAESLGCAAFILGIGGGRVRFERVREVAALLGAAVGVNALSACIGAATAMLAASGDFSSAWRSWYVSDGLGILIVAPLVVTWARVGESVLPLRADRAVELAGFVVAWCVSAWLALHAAAGPDTLSLQPYMLIALLAWPAFRLGQHVVTLALVLMLGVEIADYLLHYVAAEPGSGGTLEHLLASQAFLAFAGATGLLLAASYAEMRAEHERSHAGQERLLLATNAGNIGIWDWDVTADALVWDDRMLALSGLRADDVGAPYATWRRVLHPDDRHGAEAAITAALTGGQSLEMECRIVRPDGAIRILHCHAQVQRDATGRAVRMTGSAVDVTDRRQAEDDLRRSERDLREAERVAHVGHWMWDTRANQVFWSDEMKRMWGIDPEEVRFDLAKVIAERIHPDDTARVDASNAEVLGEGGPAPLEYRIIVPERGVRTILATPGARLTAADGAIIQLSGVVQDVTDARRAEADRAELQAQLTQAQKMESVGRLAGGVAHDFNNMLGVILGHAELAMRSLAPSEPLYEDLAEIRAAARRSADLTRQLLAFARRQEVVRQVLDLNQQVALSLKMLQRLIGENVSLTWKPASALWPILMDPSQLDQILANLCVNARDAIADVGTLTIKTANCSLDAQDVARYADAVPGDFVRLSVADTGEGMADNVLAKIFEPFFTTKGVGEGTGLGLAMVYGAVRQNDGFIAVDSTMGEGTTFDIYLPRHGDQPAPTDDARTPVATDVGSETILLVEDERALLRLATSALEALGYKVWAVTSPAEAIRLSELHGDRIDLLLTDMVMPGMNGRDLAHVVTSRNPAMKRLFMSGFAGERVTGTTRFEQEQCFIAKPFTLAELAAKVRAVLDDPSDAASSARPSAGR